MAAEKNFENLQMLNKSLNLFKPGSSHYNYSLSFKEYVVNIFKKYIAKI